MEDEIQNISNRLNRSIVFIGLMGVGKTRIGRAFAKSLKMPFIDSDEEIEKAASMPVSDIFERFGEDYFRDGERRVIQRLVEGKENKIIALGGGAVMTPATAEIVKKKTLSVWIKADIEIMVKRTSLRDTRPLLRNGNPREILEDLSEKRYPVYEQADVMIESRDISMPKMLAELTSKVSEYLNEET